MTNRERLIQAGWEQGVIFPPDDKIFKNGGLDFSVPTGTFLLIVSQTCDLVQGSFETEPYFEALSLFPLNNKPNGQYLGGKNSRRIEFSLDEQSENATYWYTLPYERHLIKRELLLELKASNSLGDDNTLKMILCWLSRRYTRTAFPEEFVTRIDARKSQIGKNFARLNSLVSNVYVRVIPFDELNDTEVYSMEIILMMDAQKFDVPKIYADCNEIKNQLEKQLDRCKGIDVEDINIESTASVTIEDLKGYLEWDYSYLSFREPEEAEMPVNNI